MDAVTMMPAALAAVPSRPDDTGVLTNAAAAATALTVGDPQASPAPPPYVPQQGDTGPLMPGQPFGPRYHIIRLLGAGGMGAVYQAWDAELGISVAIKVIRPEIAADPDAAASIERRFKRELLLARQVTHKNVVRIYDLGEIDGIKYITMAYVDGTDLGSVLRQKGRLPIPTVMPIARSIVSGLVAAHAAGVVHRDLKPANIVIGKDGEALIMDFGIARSSGGDSLAPTADTGRLPAHSAALRSAAADATSAGVIVGTVEYMAPEQARGQPADQRADIYAFGLMVYDALVGRRRAERAISAFEELQTRMQHAPESARSLVPGIPEALDRLIARCIDPDPSRRYQTATALAGELASIDDDGEAVPVKRVVGMRILAAVVMAAVTLLGVNWWYATRPPPAPHDPVSMVIADFENLTGDAAFDRTLEPMIRRALEDAQFITAYDRSAISRTLGVAPPARLDEQAAGEIAVKQGLGVVLSGSVTSQPRQGYAVSLKAVHAVTGAVIADTSARASSRDEVLPTATRLVTSVRKALGDETSDSAQFFAMTSLSATSIDVVRHYAAAMDALTNGHFERAMDSFRSAVSIDPTFGIAYSGMAAASRNLGKAAEAEQYMNEALRYLSGMTERERYNARGLSYRMTGDYKKCVGEYGELIKRYSADPIAHNQLALCQSKLRDLPSALQAMRRVVQLLPKRALYRDNLALYASYAGEFQTAEEEALKVEEPDVFAALAIAFAQTGSGRTAEAARTYQRMAGINSQGASLAALGLGDLAMFEGRYADAVRVLTEGAAADLGAGNPQRAASKVALLAHVHLRRDDQAAALAAARTALSHSRSLKTQFLAAQAFVAAGEIDAARELAAAIAALPQLEPQAFAKIIEGEALLKNGATAEAIKVLGEANDRLDTWNGRFAAGRAYLEAGQFALADGELDRSIKRRGEALALFLDEEPTYGFMPMAYYYQGRVREALKSTGHSDSYEAYLRIRGKSGEDALVREVRQRLNKKSPL